MDKKENLKTAYEAVQKGTRQMLDDITEEESLNPTRGLCNHIKWQTGHLAYCVDAMITILGGDAVLAEQWYAPYKGGVELTEDNSVYPPFEELRAKLYELYDIFNKQLESSDDEKLDEVVVIFGDWKENRLNGIWSFVKHECYHMGQLTIIRKNLKRDRPFG